MEWTGMDWPLLALLERLHLRLVVVLDVLLGRRHLLLGGARQRLLPRCRGGGHPRGAAAVGRRRRLGAPVPVLVPRLQLLEPAPGGVHGAGPRVSAAVAGSDQRRDGGIGGVRGVR